MENQNDFLFLFFNIITNVYVNYFLFKFEI
jgi:hypothetical protein